MSSDVKIYKLKDFIRKTETGDLSYDRIVEIIHEISMVACLFDNHNILLDLRKTEISITSMCEVMKVATELAQFKNVLKNKIASVIPDDVNRIAVAEKAETSFQIKGFQYRYFTDFEDAIEWLSERKDLI